MQRYLKQLLEDGMNENRAKEIATAVEALHIAMCKLDLRNLRLFVKHGIAGNLKRYAETEGVRNVITETWNAKIERAFRLTDTSGEIDVRKKTDELHEALQDFAELGLPGAVQCSVALCQFRKMLEEKV
jgi:hypothetical protein